MRLVNWFFMVAAGFSAAQGFAGQGLVLGHPTYGGTGCPRGSASVTLSPDQQALSILFDQFTLEAGGMSGKRIDRKGCNIAIPFQVPQGFSVSILEVDYRGFYSLPRSAFSQFNVEYFFAGGRGPSFSKRFFGPASQDFTIDHALSAVATVWSPCGASVILRTNASMFVQTNSRGEQAIASVDSMDLRSGIVYHLLWKRCGDGFGSGHSPGLKF
ncbi:MAG: hypothetical protein A2428_13545 [Bdellovibrionales bacterium RIFOXYC1_FULL_54_43]|nr:MAG: hypothetical protein A2428_13545 [Bdellovibrionales bacterium RIFOXYC1_FULL_54_43]